MSKASTLEYFRGRNIGHIRTLYKISLSKLFYQLKIDFLVILMILKGS